MIKRKDILVIKKVPTQGLGDTTIKAEAEYFINFSKSEWRFCFSLHYNGSNILFVHATKIYQFKAKDFEIKAYMLPLGNI